MRFPVSHPADWSGSGLVGRRLLRLSQRRAEALNLKPLFSQERQERQDFFGGHTGSHSMTNDGVTRSDGVPTRFSSTRSTWPAVIVVESGVPRS